MYKKPPLAEQLRPQTLSEVVGQQHLLQEGGFLFEIIRAKTPLSIILFGPPGCGKTSIARLYAKAFSMEFKTLSPIFGGIAELKKIVGDIKSHPLFQKGTLLFVDEIHRFNRAQQDAFLPYVEDGTITLVGATAENPAYHLNNALLSRLRVLTLNSLIDPEMEKIITRYEKTFSPLPIEAKGRQTLIDLAQGDGRYLLNLIENLSSIKPSKPLTKEELASCLQKRAPLYDRAQSHHHQQISALHKAVRGSDPDAALYWFARMITGGEDLLYIARRLIRIASEDVGLADPNALPLAIAAKDAYEMLGSPEGELSLAQVVIYLALAPKSNATYLAYNKAIAEAKDSSQLSPPKAFINATTTLGKSLGFGKDYKYDHDHAHGCAGQDFFPKEIEEKTFYQPVERGFERELKKRLQFFQKIRQDL